MGQGSPGILGVNLVKRLKTRSCEASSIDISRINNRGFWRDTDTVQVPAMDRVTLINDAPCRNEINS
jgi:hypothetical protein